MKCVFKAEETITLCEISTLKIRNAIIAAPGICRIDLVCTDSAVLQDTQELYMLNVPYNRSYALASCGSLLAFCPCEAIIPRQFFPHTVAAVDLYVMSTHAHNIQSHRPIHAEVWPGKQFELFILL